MAGPGIPARVSYGERKLVVLVREGAWDVRDFAPEPTARRALLGLRVPPYDPHGLPGRGPAVSRVVDGTAHSGGAHLM